MLSDREVSPQLGLLKSTLLQLDSTFSERDYGVSTFRDFIEKVAKTGLVTLRQSGRSMMVEAVESNEGAEAPQAALSVAPPAAASVAPADLAPEPQPVSQPQAAPIVRDPQEVQQIADATRDVFGRAAQAPRWPMYVRQLKQYLRVVDSTFDERKWGFTTVMEFLRLLQREGLFRLERDRRGQIRVFPGAALQRDAPVPASPADAQPDEIREDALGAEAIDREPEGVSADSIDDPLQADTATADAVNIDEPKPQPVRARRTRKTPTTGRPAARKSNGARAPRRRKTPVPA